MQRTRESVWDYPRPPRVEPADRPVRVELAGELVAESGRAVRVLETASPPTIYLPPDDVRTELLEPAEGQTVCEWKGNASYWHVRGAGERAERAAWTYAHPKEGYSELADWISFYPSKLDCYLGEERARAQEGGYYGGWITSELEGPFKGEPGSEGW